VICMPTVTMTMEEYLQLVENTGVKLKARPATQSEAKVARSRKGTPDPKMSRALKKANSWGRTRSGKLRKGVSQGDIMRKAHKLRRKM